MVFGPPAADLLDVGIDELHLLSVNLLNAVEGGVVEHVRAHPCLGQCFEVFARVVQGAIDHAGDQRHLVDRLPVYRVFVRHVGSFGSGHSGFGRRFGAPAG